MVFIDPIIQKDKEILLYIHSLGSQEWDTFWLLITNPISWIPFFIILFFLGLRVYGLKKSIVISLIGIGAGSLSFLIVNLIKETIKRVRPINDTSINEFLRILIEHNDYSFVSGHSTVSFTMAIFSYLLLKNYYKFSFLIFLFPLFFAYSRMYLAAHFPLDILAGMFLGLFIGYSFYRIYKLLKLK